jgi:hypothetical protein
MRLVTWWCAKSRLVATAPKAVEQGEMVGKVGGTNEGRRKRVVPRAGLTVTLRRHTGRSSYCLATLRSRAGTSHLL